LLLLLSLPSWPISGWTCQLWRWSIPSAMSALEPTPDLLKAVNEARVKAFALWITFLTVSVYLTICVPDADGMVGVWRGDG
jgi:hypothetical protein